MVGARLRGRIVPPKRIGAGLAQSPAPSATRVSGALYRIVYSGMAAVSSVEGLLNPIRFSSDVACCVAFFNMPHRGFNPPHRAPPPLALRF